MKKLLACLLLLIPAAAHAQNPPRPIRVPPRPDNSRAQDDAISTVPSAKKAAVPLGSVFAPSAVGLTRFTAEREAELAAEGYVRAPDYATTGAWEKLTPAGIAQRVEQQKQKAWRRKMLAEVEEYKRTGRWPHEMLNKPQVVLRGALCPGGT